MVDKRHELIAFQRIHVYRLVFFGSGQGGVQSHSQGWRTTGDMGWDMSAWIAGTKPPKKETV